MWIKEKFLFRFLDFSEGGRRYIARLATPKIIGGKKKEIYKELRRTTSARRLHIRTVKTSLIIRISVSFTRGSSGRMSPPLKTTYIHVYVKYIFLIKIYWKKRFSKKKQKKNEKDKKGKKLRENRTGEFRRWRGDNDDRSRIIEVADVGDIEKYWRCAESSESSPEKFGLARQ